MNRSLRRGLAVLCAVTVVTSCAKPRNTMIATGVGATALGAALGYVWAHPCGDEYHDPCSTGRELRYSGTGALVGLGAFGAFALYVLVATHHSSVASESTSQSTESSDGGYDYEAPTANVDESDGEGDAEAPGEGTAPCLQMTVGAGGDPTNEPSLPASGDQQHVTAFGTGGAPDAAIACGIAKTSAFLQMRTECNFDAGYRLRRLNQWVVYHQACSCSSCGSNVSCSVTVEGVCSSNVPTVPEFGFSRGPTRELAARYAEAQATQLCTGTSVATDVLGCEPVGGEYACAVAVTCRR